EGDSVILGCTYTPGLMDTGELDIEWSVVSPDTTQKDELLMSFTGGTKYIHTNHALAKGLDFAAGDPSMGDASLSIAVLSHAHSATYQCKVKKSPGVDMRKVSLAVMAKPSVPKCWVEGGELLGEAVSLHCNSAKGSTPLNYMWKRERGGLIPAIATQNSVTGQLEIRNLSQSFAGIYLCEVTNAVGAEQCRINLKAHKPPNRAAVIVGTVVGSVLLVILLLLFIWLLLCKISDRPRYEKEVSNEIREDAPAPESRPTSRGTSRSAIRHPEVTYSPVGKSELSNFDDGRTYTPSTNSPLYTPIKYDSKCGCAV
uniref:Ig-like domain-containing protein n=2 Tax=Myripristis murdjan TaxID=586833 RepID=A0A667ZRL0_9TELE